VQLFGRTRYRLHRFLPKRLLPLTLPRGLLRAFILMWIAAHTAPPSGACTAINRGRAASLLHDLLPRSFQIFTIRSNFFASASVSVDSHPGNPKDCAGDDLSIRGRGCHHHRRADAP
jgi:hypothetical protein